jgi:hypothetical protein
MIAFSVIAAIQHIGAWHIIIIPYRHLNTP